jgi:hypothetical protein
LQRFELVGRCRSEEEEHPQLHSVGDRQKSYWPD